MAQVMQERGSPARRDIRVRPQIEVWIEQRVRRVTGRESDGKEVLEGSIIAAAGFRMRATVEGRMEDAPDRLALGVVDVKHGTPERANPQGAKQGHGSDLAKRPA